ncbi:PaaI family thioesterase [Pseudomaricurvus sp. HS19]|uniref:PaaI family thioesterase n=1 Tax=Pseudomaricurvus sp. HS19 TaxID=2692626 RepID=UPI0013684A10|nr:PaaI family thioesterase [Pseudomaricurvus sp. HS19]MYM64440.1 hotdog fold thioesterase [Pseudomaricurvus sp. HS19]
MSAAELSGLELIHAIINGHIPPPSIAQGIPMGIRSAEHGKVVFEASADERHLNPMGGVHGGFAATVLDSATGSAVHSALEAGTGFATVDLNVKMVRPVPQRRTLLAEGNLLHLSRTIAISEASLKDESGKLYAHATATCKILRD